MLFRSFFKVENTEQPGQLEAPSPVSRKNVIHAAYLRSKSPDTGEHIAPAPNITNKKTNAASPDKNNNQYSTSADDLLEEEKSLEDELDADFEEF